MKKSLFLLASMAAILAACTKELNDLSIKDGGLQKVTIYASGEDTNTKTTLEGNTFAWGGDENIVVVDGTTTPKYFTVSDRANGKFTGTKDGDLRFAATPVAAFSTIPVSGTVLNVYMPAAYDFGLSENKTVTNALMIAGPPQEEDGKYLFTFKHAAALVKITVENLPVGTKSLLLTTDQYISGYVEKDVSGFVEVASSELQAATKSVKIGFSTAVASPNSTKVFYVPVPVGEYKEFTVTLLDATDNPLATKSKVLASAIPVERADVLSLPVITLPGVAMPYACLTFEDYANADGTSNSYAEVTVTKTHGDAWETNACESGTAIQVGRFDSGSHKDSYIKLPDFADNIKTVTITLTSVTADKTINLETTADGKTGSIASVTTTSDLVYNFDLTSGAYKTAYIRVSGAATYIYKIEVTAGDDTRTALADPAGVSANLNSTDPAVTNSIDITWSNVENAGSYLVNLFDGTDITTVETASNYYTATGLLYNTEYMFTVQALPSDPYVYKPSGEADASNTVTTGAEPGGAKFVKVTDANDVVTGEYVIAAYVGSKYYAMSNTFAGKPTAAEITVSDNKIAEADATDYVVTLTVSEGTVSISDGTQYLNCAASGTNLSVADDPVMHLLQAGTAGTFRICHPTTTTRAILYQSSGAQFGNYATSNAGNGTYYDVELFLKEDNRLSAGLAWDNTSATATIESGNIIDFTQPTLTNDFSVEVTYQSNNAAVADVDATTGIVDIVGEGEATISAVFAGDATYKPATVSYTVTVTDNRAPVATPTFTPGAGEVTPGTAVTISCPDADEIYYTTDGTTPENQTSTLYTEPVTVNDAVTIKAVAYKDGYKPSAVATAAYTIPVAAAFTTVAELNALATSTETEYTGTLTDAVVSFVPNSGNAIIKDATGSTLLYKTGHGLSQGQTFSGSLTVKIKLYNDCAELTACDATFEGAGTVVEPADVTLAELAGNLSTYQNAYVKVDDLTVTEVNAKNITVTDGTNSYVVYSSAANATCVAQDVISVVGTIAHYGSSDQIKAWTADAITITQVHPAASHTITLTQPTGEAATAGCSIAATVGGTPIASGDEVQEGETVTITATAGTGYNFSSWTVSGATVSGNTATATFTVGTSDVTVSASFSSSSVSTTTDDITSGTFTSANSKLTLTTANGVTIEQSKVSGSTAVNASYNSVSTLRVYKGHALTFSGKTFTRIEITVNGTYYGNTLTANTGTLTPTTTSGGTIIWEGNADSVVITNTATASNVQLRTKSFKVTYEN